ncbi:Fic family protein [Tessaracoccus sp. OH4464_COT-324]|uniref:Fic/DOC family protein n=1 Tax=Tessaracoccus sp. OH4464_COT-324 TaxID=2491059 RepID=UPI000F62DD0D|nr:Fic family protein [Tessaracoccus sp. OH4464_COT-324]RRD44756.1 cell filamentation protein Fic [Tessaracoccus sp. OH4464_COT-324]
MASSDFVDPYIDPETGLLKNKVGARTKGELEQAEGDLSFARLIQLMENPPPATGDLAEFCAIHRQLFQDVYPWAGEVRTVDIRKSDKGSACFMPVALIPRGSRFAAEELRREHGLKGLNRAGFVRRLAHHYDQFNYIHPFRDGNGRTQRVFWNRVALDAGWQLNWHGVRGEINDSACRAAAEDKDLRPLVTMFDGIVSEAPPPSKRDANWRRAERDRLWQLTSRRPSGG